MKLAQNFRTNSRTFMNTQKSPRLSINKLHSILPHNTNSTGTNLAIISSSQLLFLIKRVNDLTIKTKVVEFHTFKLK